MDRTSAGNHPQRVAGFTLIDTLVVVTLVVVMAVLILPGLGNTDHSRAVAAARILRSDIELAQTMSISRPDNPIVVRFDLTTNSYWLAFAQTPNTPIPRMDTGEDYLVILGEGRAGVAEGVQINLMDIFNETLHFNAFGGVDNVGPSPRIQLLAGSGASTIVLTLNVSPATGTITES